MTSLPTDASVPALTLALLCLLLPALALWRSTSKRALARRLPTMSDQELLARFDIDRSDPDGLNAYAKEYFRRQDTP